MIEKGGYGTNQPTPIQPGGGFWVHDDVIILMRPSFGLYRIQNFNMSDSVERVEGMDQTMSTLEALQATSSRMAQLIARAETLINESREFIVDHEESNSLEDYPPLNLNDLFEHLNVPRFAREVVVISESPPMVASPATIPLRGNASRWLGSPPPRVRRWSDASDYSTDVEEWEDPHLTPSYFFEFDDSDDETVDIEQEQQEQVFNI